MVGPRQCIKGLLAAFMMLSGLAAATAQPRIKGPLYLADRVMSTNRISGGGRIASMKDAEAELTPLASIRTFPLPEGTAPRPIARDYAYLCDMLAGGRGTEVIPLLFADGLYPQSDTLFFLRGRAAWSARQFPKAESLMAAVPGNSVFSDPASLCRGISLVCMGMYTEAVQACSHIDSEEYAVLRGMLLDGIEPLMQERRRSPVAAAAMSAVIPGSGKIYAGNLREGVSALITVGALAGMTVESISKNGMGDWRSIGLAALSGLFYAANIYGSYLSVSTTETLIDNARKTAVLFTVGVPLSELMGR